MANGSVHYDAAWYKEVVELRKKAGEYRVSFNYPFCNLPLSFLHTSESWLVWRELQKRLVQQAARSLERSVTPQLIKCFITCFLNQTNYEGGQGEGK